MTRSFALLLIAALACVANSASAEPVRHPSGRTIALATPAPHSEPARSAALLTSVTLGDLGFAAGLRFSNLGGRRDIFVPMPEGADISVSEIRLVLDDITAREARRNLEILVNDHSAAAIALDGRGLGRVIRLTLAGTRARHGFLKLGFIYSGAASQDRCIDVRTIGDSLTLRAETALEIEIRSATLDIMSITALMPRNVSVVIAGQRPSATDVAAALTVGRRLKTSGHRVTFHQGFDSLPELTKRDDSRRWTRGLVLIGSPQDVAPYLDGTDIMLASIAPADGALAVARVDGLPALVVADSSTVPAARLLGSRELAAVRGMPLASVGAGSAATAAGTWVTFDELALSPDVAEVFGRADIVFTIPTRMLPAGTRPSRLALDVMVAPDGAGEKAVISTFVNDRLLGSTVAAVGKPTKLDLELPKGLIGADLNVRTQVQRRSAQGDCQFEPQGYPAQILGSSAVIVVDGKTKPNSFADLAAFWATGVEVWLPSPALTRTAPMLGLITDALARLSPDTAPIAVKFVRDQAPTPTSAFIALTPQAPAGATSRVHFDRGRIAVTDREGKTLMDLGGATSSAVAQIVSAGSHPGLWIKVLAADSTPPAPGDLRLDRGDVAFIDQSGIALALSNDRDASVRVTYPDQLSWLTIAERFRPWIIGALWLFATVMFMLLLQRMLRRRGARD